MVIPRSILRNPKTYRVWEVPRAATKAMDVSPRAARGHNGATRRAGARPERGDSSSLAKWLLRLASYANRGPN